MEIWLLIILYFIAMAVIGIVSYKKANDLTNFVVGGRKAGPWVSALTYGSTYFSAVLFIGYAGRSGWDFGFWAILVGIGNALIGTYLAWKVLASRTREVTRRLKIKTMPQMFENRYDSKALKIFSAFIIFIFMIPYSASVYSGLSYLCESVLKIDYNIAMFLIAAAAAVYLVLGGYLASLTADFVQGLLIVFGVIAMMIFILMSQPAGGLVNAVSNTITKMNDAGILNLNFTMVINLIALIALTSFGTWGMPQMIHKFYAIESEDAIIKGRRISTAFALLVSCGAYFIGGLSRIFLPSVPLLSGKANYDLIIPTILSQTLPNIMLGIVMVLVLAASVSTLSGITLSSSSTVAIDLLPLLNKKLGKDKTSFFITRILCLLFIVVSYIIATMKSPILVLMAFSWGTVAGSLLAPYLLGLWWKKMNKTGAWFGMVGGFLTSIILAVSSGLNGANAPLFGVISMVMSFILSILGSLLFKKQNSSYNKKAEEFFDIEYIQE